MTNCNDNYLNTFIDRIKTRYCQRYDYDYFDENLQKTEWISDQLQALEDEVEQDYELWMPVRDLLLLYVDWFFGYKSLRNMQSLGLLFDIYNKRVANRIFAKFYTYICEHKHLMSSNPNWLFEHCLYKRRDLDAMNERNHNDHLRFRGEGINYSREVIIKDIPSDGDLSAFSSFLDS